MSHDAEGSLSPGRRLRIREAKTVEVLLNVYHISEPGLLESVGLGLFHSGIEVYGKEWSFGGSSSNVSGIFWLSPKSAPLAFKESIRLGEVACTPAEVGALVQDLEPIWMASDYHLLTKNCNHFSEAFAELLGLEVPEWLNRAARLGDVLLPDSFIDFLMEKASPPQSQTDGTQPIPSDLETMSVRQLKQLMAQRSLQWDGMERMELVACLRQHP